jgi:hypothetical protein
MPVHQSLYHCAVGRNGSLPDVQPQYIAVAHMMRGDGLQACDAPVRLRTEYGRTVKTTLKATKAVCGEARRDDMLTAWWGLVTCERCLRAKPLPTKGPTVWRCRETTCDAVLSGAYYRLCIRCPRHCLAAAPDDEQAHRAQEEKHAASIRTHRKRP